MVSSVVHSEELAQTGSAFWVRYDLSLMSDYSSVQTAMSTVSFDPDATTHTAPAQTVSFKVTLL